MYRTKECKRHLLLVYRFKVSGCGLLELLGDVHRGPKKHGQMDKHLTKHLGKVHLFVVHLSCCVLCMSDLTSINPSRTPTLPGLSLS